MAAHDCRIRASPGALAILRHLDAVGEIAFDHWHIDGDAYISTFRDDEISLLESHGLEVTRIARAGERAAGPMPSGGDTDDTITTGFVTSYLDAPQVAARMAALAAEFPSLCHVSSLPELTTGYDGATPGLGGPAQVQLVRITSQPGVHSRPGLLLVCGTHAREWINPLIAIEFAEQLLRNYSPGSSDPDVVQVNRIVDQGDVFLVPVMNPDGLNFSRHDDADWRKSRRPHAVDPNCPGVDNNRNYEVYFGGSGSAPVPCAETYRGAGPFSEAENRNIRYILETFPNILIGIDSHSQGQKIFRPHATGTGGVPSFPVHPDDQVSYAHLEQVAAAAILAVDGTAYQVGSTSNHAGTSDEYMFFAHRIFGFDFECGLAHQPPFADALAAVRQVTAALRRLATEAIDLSVAATTPARVVQCLDRTGSMIALGYEAPARSNAKRLIDMQSIGDSVAVVTFADPSSDPTATPVAARATVELALTDLNDAGDFAIARAAVDGIVFGGWTPIGAGLQRAVAELSGAPPTRRAIVLLSDGYENRDPSAASVLGSIPADVRVFTIALGSLADIPLLQSIATSTGGQFYVAPTTLELHEIYNQIRTSVSDDDMVMQRVVTRLDAACAFPFWVEHAAQRLTVSASWDERSAKSRLSLVDPFGRRHGSAHWGVEEIQGDDYRMARVLRPAPGRWQVELGGAPRGAVIAAFVASPLKLGPLLHKGGKVRLEPVIDGFGLSRLVGSAHIGRMPAARPIGLRRGRQLGDDRTEVGVIRLGAIRFARLAERVREGFRSPTPSVPLTCADLRPAGKRGYELTLPSAVKAGVYNMRLHLEGEGYGGARFERAVYETLVVPSAQTG